MASPLESAAAAPLTCEWSPPYPVDVRLVLSVHVRGPRDPAYRADASGAVWRTVLTPDGTGGIDAVGGIARPPRVHGKDQPHVHRIRRAPLAGQRRSGRRR